MRALNLANGTAFRHHLQAMQMAAAKPDSVNFDDVAELARDDMDAVNRLISSSLESDVALVSQVSEYIVMSGGKRLRPMIVLLAARALGYGGKQHSLQMMPESRAIGEIECPNAVRPPMSQAVEMR
ncbi:MAG: polyprenyl synthetase family protein [Woeseiaceae bacterium]